MSGTSTAYLIVMIAKTPAHDRGARDRIQARNASWHRQGGVWLMTEGDSVLNESMQRRRAIIHFVWLVIGKKNGSCPKALERIR